MNNLVHFVLTEKIHWCVSFSICVYSSWRLIYWKRTEIEKLAESLSTLTLVRSFRWLNFWYENYPEYPRKILYLPEYNKIISYGSYVFIPLYSQRVNGVLYFFFFSVIAVLCFFHSYSVFFWSLLLLVDLLFSESSDLLPPIFFQINMKNYRDVN